MGTKNRQDMFSLAYREASEDEPIMVLTARDLHAAVCVDMWASLVRPDFPEMADAANRLAVEMRKWRKART